MERESIQIVTDTSSEPLCISIPKAAKLLGVSRNTGYAMAKIGQLPTIKCGKRRLLVPKAALMEKLQIPEKYDKE